jgi:hypothetical protein
MASSASTRPLLDWREVEAPDYPTYIGNLRAIGVPDLNFWETPPDDPAARAELMRQRREVDEAVTVSSRRDRAGERMRSPRHGS